VKNVDRSNHVALLLVTMQGFKIIASDGQKELLRQLLRSANCQEDDNSDYVLVESGLQVPPKGLSLVFRNEDIASLLRLLNDLSGKQVESAVLIGRKHETFEPIKPEDILFFKADGNNMYAHTGKQAYEMKQKLFEIEKMISRNNFIRINKSYIVNILKVKEIIPWFGGRLLLKFSGSEEKIEVSRNYVKDFKQFLGM